MIVSKKHQFVFIHNPKAAGTAIRQRLQMFDDTGINWWHQAWVPQLDRVVDMAHIKPTEMFQILEWTKSDEVSFFMVSRDPYSKFSSGLAEIFRQHPEDRYKFQNWTQWCAEYMDEQTFRFNWKYTHLCPQHYFWPPEWITKKHHYRMDEVSKLWDLLRQKFGLPSDEPMPRVRIAGTEYNPLDLGDLMEHPAAVARINAMYQRDFELFGYEMQGPRAEPMTHYERVNAIHNPHLEWPDEHQLSAGELIAYRQQKEKACKTPS